MEEEDQEEAEEQEEEAEVREEDEGAEQGEEAEEEQDEDKERFRLLGPGEGKGALGGASVPPSSSAPTCPEMCSKNPGHDLGSPGGLSGRLGRPLRPR